MGRYEPDPDLDFRGIIESIPTIVFITEAIPDCAWTYVNEWIEPILGFTVDEWLSTDGAWERQVHPDDRERVFANENQEVEQFAAAGDHERRGMFHDDYRMLHKDGHTVWVRDSSTLIATASGRLYWHGILFDISDQKLVEQALERRSAAQTAVADLGEHGLSGVPIEKLLKEACRSAKTVLGADVAVIGSVGAESSASAALELVATSGWAAPDSTPALVPIDPRSCIEHTLRTAQPMLIEDWEQEQRFTLSDTMAARGMRSTISVRIEGGSGPWGMFGVLSRRPHAFNEADVAFIQSLANILADAITRQASEEAMQHRALHDPLTGLPNRVLFTDRLEQTLERARRHPGSLSALLFIDIDHFKQVNDTLGHHAGDQLLAGVAKRLREAVRPNDTVARFGGDEFGLLLDDIASERVAIKTAERIAASFTRPFLLDGGPQFATVSVGIALADGQQDAHALLRNADLSMYRAKERGRARYDLFDADLRLRTMARTRVENELRQALDNDELRLVFQPVVRLRDETIDGVEMLLRWAQPLRQPVGPSEFIAVAEESGLIDRIGTWAMEEALHQVSRLAWSRPDAAPLKLGLNISVYQLQNPRFVEVVEEALAGSDVDPGSVYLEFGEQVLREAYKHLRPVLHSLQELGTRLVIHDFGAGDSSLTQLAEMPIDTIKIDRRFVGKLGTDDVAARIGEAAARASMALDRAVVGIGAETADQVQELRRLGCHAAQGHFFSVPLPVDDLALLIRDPDALKRTLM